MRTPTREQRTVIYIGGVILGIAIFWTTKRRKDMNTATMKIPEFLRKGFDAGVTKESNRGLRALTNPVDDAAELEVDEPFQMEEAMVGEVENTAISSAEREKLSMSIRGMSSEQMMIIAENIPIDICFARIGKEIERNKAFAEAIKDAVTILS